MIAHLLLDHFSSLQLASSLLVASILFFLIIAFYAMGHFFVKRNIKETPGYIYIELGSINGALLALVGLILAFTFSMASSRFGNRRKLVIEEANAIGTAILRKRCLPG